MNVLVSCVSILDVLKWIRLNFVLKIELVQDRTGRDKFERVAADLKYVF